MRLFACQRCGNLLHFENTRCEGCGAELGFLADAGVLSALEATPDGLTAAAAPGEPQRRCANAALDACNWLVPAADDQALCRACRHNRTIPDLSDPARAALFRRMQVAQHRLIHALDRMGLGQPDKATDPERGLGFDILADPDDPDAPRVMTGHHEGLITLALAEADDAERERRRSALGEPYRTLLGHFRHEVGHHFWNRLIRDAGQLERCRAVFGDERADYTEALAAHYARGADDSWRGRFITAYAAAHPWEDWAESWAHYMHILDTLEMAESFGLTIRPRLDQTGELSARIRLDPHAEPDFARIIAAWTPLTVAANSLNRCMGTPDAYPFVMSDAIVEKLAFLHGLVLDAARGLPQEQPAA